MVRPSTPKSQLPTPKHEGHEDRRSQLVSPVAQRPAQRCHRLLLFPHVYVFGRGEAFLPFDRNTYVIMASRLEFDGDRFDAITAQDDPSTRTTRLAEERLTQYVASGRSLTLTDDFVPVDQLLARLFIERGNR